MREIRIQDLSYGNFGLFYTIVDSVEVFIMYVLPDKIGDQSTYPLDIYRVFMLRDFGKRFWCAS